MNGYREGLGLGSIIAAYLCGKLGIGLIGTLIRVILGWFYVIFYLLTN